MADKPLGCVEERRVEGGLAGGVDLAGMPEVDLLGCHQADACVIIVLIILGEEATAERVGLIDGLEPSW